MHRKSGNYLVDAILAPRTGVRTIPVKCRRFPMDWMLATSFDTIVMSALTCLIVREAMIFALPDTIAGPGGSLIDTGHE